MEKMKMLAEIIEKIQTVMKKLAGFSVSSAGCQAPDYLNCSQQNHHEFLDNGSIGRMTFYFSRYSRMGEVS